MMRTSTSSTTTMSTGKVPGRQQSSSSSVLEAGTVEARGIGVSGNKKQDAIQKEIQDFLNRPLSFRDEVRSFFTVWAFLTRLPSPSYVDHHPGYLMRGMVTFPMIGTWIGYFCSVWYQVTLAFLETTTTTTTMADHNLQQYEHQHTMIASFVSLAASFWLTGCFHEDGLADSSDGIGGGWSRKQILTIMSDTRLGTYGCAVLILYIYAKLGLVATLNSSRFMMLAHTYARWTACFLIRTNDYVDDSQGPKTAYYSFMCQAKHLVTWPRVAIATLYTVSIGMWCFDGSWMQALQLLLVVAILSMAAGWYATDLLGGVMGDYLGATICIAEIVVYIVSLKLSQQQQDQQMDMDYDNRSLEMLWNTIPLPAISENQQRVGLQFLCLVLATILWNRNIGLPNVFVRETVIANQEKDELIISVNPPSNDDNSNKESEEKLATTTPDNQQPRNQDDPNNKQSLQLQHLLQSKPNATFKERYEVAQTYVDGLAKPMGSLGTLEEWACRLMALATPKMTLAMTGASVSVKASCLIFAGDHGVAKSLNDGGEQCSAYPQDVTQSILQALGQGVAGASVLAKANHATLHVIDVAVIGTRDYHEHLTRIQQNTAETESAPERVVQSGSFRLPHGTKNSCVESAMTLDQVKQLLQVGRDSVRMHIIEPSSSSTTTTIGAEPVLPVLCLGEIGIGNTTTSSIILAAMTGQNIETLVDGGATLGKQADPALIEKKRLIVQRALQRFQSSWKPSQTATTEEKDGSSSTTTTTMYRILSELGGAELVAMAGAIMEAADCKIPVLVDGFIATTAALIACRLQQEKKTMTSLPVSQVLLFATQSTERGHAIALQEIAKIAQCDDNLPPPAQPALAMNLRMGEGTGALLALPLVQSALSMIMEMATLQQILSPSSS